MIYLKENETKTKTKNQCQSLKDFMGNLMNFRRLFLTNIQNEMKQKKTHTKYDDNETKSHTILLYLLK